MEEIASERMQGIGYEKVGKVRKTVQRESVIERLHAVKNFLQKVQQVHVDSETGICLQPIEEMAEVWQGWQSEASRGCCLLSIIGGQTNPVRFMIAARSLQKCHGRYGRQR